MGDIDWTLMAGCVLVGCCGVALGLAAIGLVQAVRRVPVPRRGRHRAFAPAVPGDHRDVPTLALRQLRAGLQAAHPGPGTRALAQQAARKGTEL